MKTIGDEYNKARRTVSQLRSVGESFASAVKVKDCDKRGIGFCLDDRFAAFKMALSFDSWKGFYGNSGCSTVIHFDDQDAVKDALVAYLNRHYPAIFKEMADDIERANEERRVQYAEELKAELAAVEAPHAN